MRDPFVDELEQHLAAHRLLPPGGRLLVGVSGGADSVALFHALRLLQPRWNWALHIAHLDHALRDSSAGDAAFVQQLGRRWKVATLSERRDVRSLCADAGWSLEDGARRIRYQFFQQAASRYTVSHVAVAHHADDQAETVCMRLVRGTGLTGLCGMPRLRPLAPGLWLARPLLGCWRTAITGFLQRHGFAHRDDPTNTDQALLRNRVRHELLPLLARQYNPSIKQALVQLAEQSQCDTGYLRQAAERLSKRIVRTVPGGVSLRIAPFRRQPKAVQRQLVRRAIASVRGDAGRLEFRHWRQAELLFLERPVGTVLDLPGAVQLVRQRDDVMCRCADPAPSTAAHCEAHCDSEAHCEVAPSSPLAVY